MDETEDVSQDDSSNDDGSMLLEDLPITVSGTPYWFIGLIAVGIIYFAVSDPDSEGQ